MTEERGNGGHQAAFEAVDRREGRGASGSGGHAADATKPATPRPRLTLALLAVAHAIIHALSALLPLVYPIVVVEYALNPADVGTFIAITTAVGGTIQLAYTVLPRYVARPLLLAGGQVVFGLGLLLASGATSIGQLLLGISASRIGSSPQHTVGNALLADSYPPERRGFAISAHVAGGNVGTIAVPLLAGSGLLGAGLLVTLGWQRTIGLLAVPALVVGVLLALLVREDHRAYRHRARSAGSVGSHARAVLARRDLRLILLASLVAAGGRGLDIVAPFMLLYLLGPLGIDRGTVSLLYLILLAGAVIGPLVAGILSDRFGRQRVLVAYYLVCAAGIGAFLLAGANLVLLMPLLVPFGAAVFSESPVLQAYLADRADGPIRDVAFGLYFTAAFGIGAGWAFIIGQVVDRVGYPPAFGLMAASYLGAALLLRAVPRDASTATTSV